MNIRARFATHVTVFLPDWFPGVTGICGFCHAHVLQSAFFETTVGNVCGFGMLQAGGNGARLDVSFAQFHPAPARTFIVGNERRFVANHVEDFPFVRKAERNIGHVFCGWSGDFLDSGRSSLRKKVGSPDKEGTVCTRRVWIHPDFVCQVGQVGEFRPGVSCIVRGKKGKDSLCPVARRHKEGLGVVRIDGHGGDVCEGIWVSDDVFVGMVRVHANDFYRRRLWVD